jgi:ABC-2 type transport system ATP-binding protein
MDAIVAEGLQKRYGDVEAVADVSFAVREGEIFGLLGPNGAGKSTTVRMLATLTRPDGGRGLVAGHDIARESKAARRALGYVAQNSGTDRYLTGRENLTIQARAQRMSRADAQARAKELLELVGLVEAADRLVQTYSGGMKRRLDIALGIVHRPSVLCLDEPPTGLDPEARATMWTELERLAQEQTLTILLTTHYLEEADRLAERVAIVSRGRVVAEGSPEQLKRDLHGDSVSVELEDGHAEAAEQVLAGHPAVLGTVRDGATLRARVEHGARSLPAILSALEERSIPIAAATVARPTLDDVYLHHTGRAFDEDDRSAA